MKRILVAALLAAAVPAASMPALAQTAEPAVVVSAAQVRALIAQAKAAPAKPVVLEPIATVAPYVVNLEYRVGPAPAAVHQTQAELMIVLDGAGTLTTGGRLTGAAAPRNGNISGTGITGGAAQHLAKGDFTIVPENTPHMLLPDGGGPLVLATLHVPRNGAPPPPAGAPSGAPKLYASAADVQALLAKAKAALKPGQPFSSESILSLRPYRVGLEYRTPTGTPSVHQTAAELMYVIQGTGTIRTDGALAQPKQSSPANLQGSAITGGVEHAMHTGDFILVPQNTPHQSFTGTQFVLATMHMPRPVPGQ